MEKSGKTKNIVLAVLLVAVVTLSIAYAVLSATLTINAQATVAGSSWDVKFQKKGSGAICVASSKTGQDTTTASVTADGTINEAGTTFSGLAASFKLPGDKVVCTWQVVNNGDFNAKLATYTAPTISLDGAQADKTTIGNNIKYTLTVNGSAPSEGMTIAKKSGSTATTQDVVLTIYFDENAEAIPAGPVTATVASETFVYQQN